MSPTKKVLFFMLGLAIALLLTIPFADSAETHDNILPDMELPWNKKPAELVETLNKIYQYKGELTQWELLESDIQGIYHMKLKNSDSIGPFRFVFKEDRLAGYLAQFPVMQYPTLVYSADVNYPKDDKDTGRGVVLSKTREFRVYEKELKFGHLELFMVWDKDSMQVRVQTKYTHKPRKKTEVPAAEPEKKEDDKVVKQSDIVATFTPKPPFKEIILSIISGEIQY